MLMYPVAYCTSDKTLAASIGANAMDIELLRIVILSYEKETGTKWPRTAFEPLQKFISEYIKRECGICTSHVLLSPWK